MPVFQTSDDVALHYELGGGQPGGLLPPVVLLHGFSSSLELNWVESGVLGALHAAGRRTLAIDARGHGKSGQPTDPARYGEARIAEDVRELLDQLDLERVDLVGYSMGAVVALLLAGRDPRVRRIVLGGIGAAAVEAGGIGPVSLPPGLPAALRADDPDSIEHPEARHWRAWIEERGDNRLALAAQAEAMHGAPLPLEHVLADVLLIVGDRDTTTGARPEVLARALPSARLLILPDDHMSAFHNPRFAAELVAFLG